MLNKIVTITSLVLLICEVLYLLINIIFKKRADRIAFLRSFKNGNFAIIYLTAIPLYFIGHLYQGENIFNAFFNAISRIIGLVVLSYDTGSISKLMEESDLYSFTIYFCFVLVAVNAIVFTLSLTIQHLWCGVQAVKAFLTMKDKLYLFGNNPENIAIYSSDKKRNKVIIDNISSADRESLYMNKISFISSNYLSTKIDKLIKFIKHFDNRDHILVINTGSDEQNIALCRSVIETIAKSNDKEKDRLFAKLRIFVFGDPKCKAIYDDIVSGGFGCIHYVNKYQEIAIDFIDRYPIASFMTDKHVDYDSSLVKDDVDINVLLVGFGETNQQIFLTSVANNQFLCKGEVDPDLKKVNYFIFDKNRARQNKNLNHSYYRFKSESSDYDPDKYLPLPTLPAEERFFYMDINSPRFYSRIKDIVSGGANDLNFIVIAFGSDLENIDMAQKLIEKRREWELENLIIFVKVRVWHKEQTLLEQPGCYFIGNEVDTVYDIEKIIGDKISTMAMMRNEVYDLEYDITHNPGIVIDEKYVKENRDRANKKWYKKKSQMERESSLYCCLSLRSKLNLMGLDYCGINENDLPALTEKEYLERYAKDDMPVLGEYSFTANGKSILNYTLDFALSRRRNMAIHEHQRWNSFMISKGMVPASRENILHETTLNDKGKLVHTNGKNYNLRRHGNITTFDGLVEFRRMTAERDNVAEELTDVIKYDYQLLDDAHWLLSTNGFKIVEKQPRIN